MSRIGRKPIPLPPGVQVQVSDGQVTVKGPKGTLTLAVPPGIQVGVSEGVVTVARPSDERQHRALHGLTRALLHNMVAGVSQGFERVLEVHGVGYRVQKSGSGIVLQVGYSHPVEVQPLPGVTLEIEGTNRIFVRGPDKQAVGEMAARIRGVRRPDSYKGKGIRYAGEVVHLKPGKSAGRKQ